MSFDLEKIKTLREETGLSLGEITSVLKKTGGDIAKAKEILSKLGDTVAVEKASRQIKEGIVEAYIHTNKKIGSLVELYCETDFVARNDNFKSLAKDIAMQVAAMRPASAEELLSQPFIKNPAQTIQELIHATIAKLGENIQLGRYQYFEISSS